MSTSFDQASAYAAGTAPLPFESAGIDPEAFEELRREGVVG